MKDKPFIVTLKHGPYFTGIQIVHALDNAQRLAVGRDDIDGLIERLSDAKRKLLEATATERLDACCECGTPLRVPGAFPSYCRACSERQS